MNTINNSADTGNRQIQPRDFSFLSEADQQLEKAMAHSIVNLHPTATAQDAVIAWGMMPHYELDISGTSVKDFYIEEGAFWCRGKLFSFPRYYFWKDGASNNQYMTYHRNGNGYISLGDAQGYYESICPPSPVFSNSGNQDVNVHFTDDIKIRRDNYSPQTNDISFLDVYYSETDNGTLKDMIVVIAQNVENDLRANGVTMIIF